jgi:hyperosmotically inducible periplasmic protein
MHKTLWLKPALLTAVMISATISAYAMSRPDAWITMKAKTALYAAEDVSGTAVDVDTINGRVTLHGKVRTEEEKTRAAEIVKGIEGVTDVRNLLQVVPAGKEKQVERADDAIQKDLEQKLKMDKSLEDSSISVKSVNKGVVLLGGKAASMDDYERALHRAASRPGVVRVTSEVEVPDALPDECYRTDEKSKRTAGDVVSDMWITSATKLKLAADSRTPATEINVDSHDGVVTLFGMVPTQQSKTAAAEIARSVAGVKNVRNEIEVVPASKQEKVQARDDEIQKSVEQALKDRGDQENASISVEVKNGVVRLTGTVPTWEKNLSAVYAARSVAGVRSVRSELKVEGSDVARS